MSDAMTEIPMDRGVEQRALLQGVSQQVARAIKRPISVGELRAFGFVIDRSGFTGPSESFVQTVLGVTTDSAGRDAAWAVHTTISGHTQEELKKRLADAQGNPKELGKLEALGRFIEVVEAENQTVYNAGNDKFSLGSVPEDWLPTWVTQPA